jgi:hypothetical protein
MLKGMCNDSFDNGFDGIIETSAAARPCRGVSAAEMVRVAATLHCTTMSETEEEINVIACQ